ncbi:MAG: hypothetical protein ACTHK0_16010 [Ginsengibacter sp.]
MNLQEFKQTLNVNLPPANLEDHLKALWFDAKGDWQQAHMLIQDVNDNDAAWIHAYLHRKEGDISNADYWYRQARKKRPEISLEKEWEQIAEALL